MQEVLRTLGGFSWSGYLSLVAMFQSDYWSKCLQRSTGDHVPTLAGVIWRPNLPLPMQATGLISLRCCWARSQKVSASRQSINQTRMKCPRSSRERRRLQMLGQNKDEYDGKAQSSA